MKLILTACKNSNNAEKILNRYVEGKTHKDKRISDMIQGFDLVDEEDNSEQISYFAKSIFEANKKLKEHGIDEGVKCILHAGESHKS